MPRRASGRLALMILGGMILAAACARPGPQLVEVGRHRLKLVPPRGWEHLDHGRQQLFRNGEAELLLEDLGPATPRGLVNELREARTLWLAGRRRDAFARVRELHGLPMSPLPSQARADFWKPWTDVTYVPEAADSAAIGIAFDELIREAQALPEVPIERLVGFVLEDFHDGDRREIAHQEAERIHGSQWLAIETWDRTSHLGRHRLACLDDGGYLLFLSTRRGLIEQSGAAFDALLASIEVMPHP